MRKRDFERKREMSNFREEINEKETKADSADKARW